MQTLKVLKLVTRIHLFTVAVCMVLKRGEREKERGERELERERERERREKIREEREK